VDQDAQVASALFGEAVAWLRQHYREFEFWVERDVVWTVQTRLRKLISDRGLPWTVFNDYPMLPVPGVHAVLIL
jgi:hypothetical protein